MYTSSIQVVRSNEMAKGEERRLFASQRRVHFIWRNESRLKENNFTYFGVGTKQWPLLDPLPTWVGCKQCFEQRHQWMERE